LLGTTFRIGTGQTPVILIHFGLISGYTAMTWRLGENNFLTDIRRFCEILCAALGFLDDKLHTK
jgi:hypothetical protein